MPKGSLRAVIEHFWRPTPAAVWHKSVFFHVPVFSQMRKNVYQSQRVSFPELKTTDFRKLRDRDLISEPLNE